MLLIGASTLLFTIPAIAQTSGITFSQILADPSNVELNLSYALQQEARGDLLSAVSAVERILLEHPENDDSRLYYADLLLKLDDRQGALREINILEGRELNAEQMGRLENYGGTARTGGSSDISARLAIGVRYDDNAGETLSDTNIVLPNSDDFAALVQGAVNFVTPVNDQMSFRAGVNGQTLRHETFSRVDYDTYGAYVGLVGRTDTISWKLDGIWSNVVVDNDRYLSQIGPKLTVMKDVSDTVQLGVKGSYFDQDFNNTSFLFGEDQRSGDYYTGSVGATIQVSPSTRLAAWLGYENKDAQILGFAYDGYRISGDIQTRFDNDMYLKGSAYYRDLTYDNNVREDNRFYVRAALGAPLNTSVEGLKIEGAVSYLDRNSTDIGLDFNNIGAEARLIWDF